LRTGVRLKFRKKETLAPQKQYPEKYKFYR
jgi:hypothetical protein